MAEPGFLVPANFLRDAAEMKKIVLGSSRTRSSKFRRRRMPGGGSTGTTLREARVTVDIPAQTLNDDGDGWRIHDTPGRVILVDSAGFDTGEDFAVTNRDDQFYAVNCRVWLDGTRVDHGSCWPVEWPTEPET